MVTFLKLKKLWSWKIKFYLNLFMGNNLSLFNDFLEYKFPTPQYLGAKYKHLNWIGKYVSKNTRIVLDVFAGSQSVAYYFKQLGYQVYTNDFLNFNNQIGKALIENNSVKLTNDDLKVLFSPNRNKNKFNLMENLFTNIFFTKEECEFLDSFRSNIELLSKTKQSLSLAIINRALTRKVTMGHFAHTKALEYANNKERVKRNRSLVRPIKDIFMELLPEYNNSIFDNHQENKSFNEDAISLIEHLNTKVDLLYLDPPYCDSHADYQSFYHLLETYTQYWKNKKFINSTHKYFPKIYSGFDTKKDITTSFERLFKQAQKIPYWLISYNDRSYPNKDEMIKLISKYKDVKLSFKEYYNNVGGKGSVKGSKELLFVCSPK